MIKIIREDRWWVMRRDGEELCRMENAEFDEAIDVFAANWPEFSVELDGLKCGEFCGTNGVKSEKRRRTATGAAAFPRKRGSGARFRELILAGKTNEECLKIVREEFPDSKATLSDAAWNRAMLRKKPSGQ